MSLDRLLYEVNVHYRSRGFPQSALTHLRWMLVTNTNGGVIHFATAYPSYRRNVADLLGHFKPCPDQPSASASEVFAVFGFAFGYRMKVWTEGKSPTEQSEVASHRIPGKNNSELAERAVRLHNQRQLPLYLQFEIADAIDGRVPVEFASSRKDQGTGAVADEFVAHVLSSNAKARAVVLLAHQHHYERCRIILEKKGIIGLPIDDPYSEYDEFEAQPRVMSPEEFIVNDFVSVAALRG
jgi:hypothetical protein